MEQSLAGTTSYLAPEQLRGKTQPASDQYALAVVVYEWLCGKLPFHSSFLEVAVQHISVDPPSLHEQVADFSPAIEEVMLQGDRKGRPYHTRSGSFPHLEHLSEGEASRIW